MPLDKMIHNLYKFGAQQSALSIKLGSLAVQSKTDVKKALTNNSKWFYTFEFSRNNATATQCGDEDDDHRR